SWIDQEGVSLIGDWIEHLPANPKADRQEKETVAKRQANATAALKRLSSKKSLPLQEQAKIIDRLFLSVGDSLALLRAVDKKALNPSTCETIIAKGTAASEPLVRDLFERF